MARSILIPICLLSLCSCTLNKNESNLSSDDKNFFNQLGILGNKETIEMFECKGGISGIKQSGNLITTDRIASYWIEEGQKEVNSAYFASEVDSISITNLPSTLIYESYLTVYKSDGKTFNIYMDTDSSRTNSFFVHAIDNWKKSREASNIAYAK